jgi:hypothetical protein
MLLRQVWVGCAGIALTITGQWAIVDVATHGDRWASARAAVALGAWLTGLALVVTASGAPAVAGVAAAQSDHARSDWSPIAVGISLIAVGLLIARGADWDGRAAAICWLIAIVALMAGAGAPTIATRWPRLRVRPSPHGWALVALVTLAGVVRMTALGTHPRIVDQDGAAFALLARDVARGRLTDPFATGYLDHPTLFAFVQRVSMALGGDTLAGARLASATAGTATVAVTYLLARRLASRTVALTAAGVLAVLPVHVHFSRLALNNVFDSLTLATGLWLVIRAIDEQRPLEAAAAGVVVGLGQHFYFSARLVAALAAVVAIWRGVEAARRGVGANRVAALWIWMLAGAITACVPLALHYLRYPATFSPRNDQVLLIGEGMAARQARGGGGLGPVLLENIGRSLISPFGRTGWSTYHPGPPTIGWAVAVPLAVGVAACTAHARRSSAGLVALVWWAAMIAVGFTVGFPATRWVFATPVIAIAVALGLEVGWRMLAASAAALGARRATANVVRRPVIALAAVVIAATGLIGEFTRPALGHYGDVNSLVVTRLTAELSDQPPGTAVFAVMSPRIWLKDAALIELATPEIEATDVVETLIQPEDVPPIHGRAAFVFLPERLFEFDVVRQRFPDGAASTRVAEGVELYTVYWVEP